MIKQIIEIEIKRSILDKVSGFELARFDIKKETNHNKKIVSSWVCNRFYSQWFEKVECSWPKGR